MLIINVLPISSDAIKKHQLGDKSNAVILYLLWTASDMTEISAPVIPSSKCFEFRVPSEVIALHSAILRSDELPNSVTTNEYRIYPGLLQKFKLSRSQQLLYSRWALHRKKNHKFIDERERFKMSTASSTGSVWISAADQTFTGLRIDHKCLWFRFVDRKLSCCRAVRRGWFLDS